MKETGEADGKEDHVRGWVTSRAKGKNNMDIKKSTL